MTRRRPGVTDEAIAEARLQLDALPDADRLERLPCGEAAAAPWCWDHPFWLAWMGYDADWAAQAWIGRAYMAEARQNAGQPLDRGDEEALRRREAMR